MDKWKQRPRIASFEMKNIKHTVVFGAFLVIGLLTAMWQIEGRAHAQGEVLSTATATPRPGSQLFDAIPTSTPVRPKIVSVIPRSPMVGDSVTVSGIAEKGGLIGIYIDEEVVKTTTASTSQA